jgi:hypothetical protein
LTPRETESLLKLMAKLGVTHLKTPLIEASLSPSKPPTQPIDIIGLDSTPTAEQAVSPPEASEAPQGNIPHTSEELASLMKLSDQELLDRLIPEASPTPEEN